MRILIPFYHSSLYLFCSLLPFACGMGCQSRQDHMWQRLAHSEASPLQEVLHANLEAIGGRTTWQKTHVIEANAVATLFDVDRSSTLVDMTQVLKFDPHPSLTLGFRLPAGTWTEHLDSGGGVRIEGAQVDPAGDEGLETLHGAGLKLRLLVQASTQAVGLLNNAWTLKYLGKERKGGRLSHKIEVQGLTIRTGQKPKSSDQKNRLVIWFDADSHLIDRLWLQYDRGQGNEAGYLAGNVGRYQRQADGLVLPTYVGVVRSDAFQQFSEQEILRVEYQDIRVR